ncbi:MAG TPA: hypothetical protein VKE69_01885 [Planctomycetota bacterium]|nr:hypothetical protein [Planctomycetota bacterium]
MRERKKTSGGKPAPMNGISPVATTAAKRDPGPEKPDEMSPDSMEFLKAVDDYRLRHSRPFPSWSEVLLILKTLGYRKVAKPTPLP